MSGSDSEGSARGSLRLPGGGGEEEEGGGGLAGQDGGLEGQDAPRLLPPPRVPGQGAEGGQKEEKKKNFFILVFQTTGDKWIDVTFDEFYAHCDK